MLLAFLIALAVICLDQLSKWLIVEYLEEDIVVIKDFFEITYTTNSGIAWGIGLNKVLLIGMPIVAAVLIIYYIYKYRDTKKNKWILVTLAFVLGGAIGNLIDRIFRISGVVDFLSFTLYYPDITNSFKIATYGFPIFNIADSFIVIGSIMLIIYVLFIEPKQEKKNGDNSK